MNFQLITPEKIAYEAEVDSVTLPTADGEITILPGHIPLVSQLGNGELMIKSVGKEHSFAVAGGFVSVAEGAIRVLAESADHADEIDLQRSEEARERAEKLRDQAQGEMEIAEASVALERALAQIKVAQRKHRHHAKSM